MNARTITIPLFGVLAWGSSIRASTIISPVDDPSITAQMYRDEATLYPSVGRVSGGFSGSGVLISDRWVLTAGHISLNRTSGSFTINGVSHTIESSITHPSFSFSGPAYDVGLLYLSAPVSGIAAATMVRFENPASILGREAIWVGNGFTGTGLTGAQVPLEFRAFTNIIDVYGDEYSLSATSFVADFDKPDGTTNASSSDPITTRLEGNVAPGDSGGGVFIRENGASYLVGINSYTAGFTPGTNSTYGSLSGAVDLHQFHSWIFDETGIAAVPEPSSLCYFTLASLIWLRRKR